MALYKMYIQDTSASQNPLGRLYAVVFFICVAIYIFTVTNTPYTIQRPKILYLNGKEVKLEHDLRVEEIEKANASEKDKVVYMSVKDLKNLFDGDVQINEEKKEIIIVTENKVVKLDFDSSKVEINGVEEEANNKIEKYRNEWFLPLNISSKIYGFEYLFSDGDVALFSENAKKEVVTLNEPTKLKANTSLISGTITQVYPNRKYIFISESNNKVKIMTDDVKIGYVDKEKVEGIITVRQDKKEETKKELNFITNYSNFKMNYSEVKKNRDKENAVLIDLFKINSEGFIEELYAVDNNNFSVYMKKIKDEKMLPIAILTGKKLNSDNSKFKERILTYKGRLEIINKIIEEVKKYDLSGIHLEIDSLTDKAALTKFINELKARLNEKGAILTTSKDNINILNIEKEVDYIV